MRYSTSHKAQTKARIVRNAGKLFAAKGFEATSIDEIMCACNLTRGGFYAHFRSKSQLYRHAIESAAEHSQSRRLRRIADDEADWIDSMLNELLDFSATQLLGRNSPLTFFATDVASEDVEVRRAYESAFKAMQSHIASRIGAHSACSEEAILSITVLIVGARAVAHSIDDELLKETLYASCRTATKTLLERSGAAPPSFFWEARLDHGQERLPDRI